MTQGHGRQLRLAMVFGVAITLFTAPAASAAFHDVIPAGWGCAFDVQLDVPDSAAGDHTAVGYGDITMTNLETGATYLQKSRHVSTEVLDEATNTLFDHEVGRIFIQFYPGDQGPYGVVEEPGALYAFACKLDITWDLDTDAYTAFTYSGLVIDLCAELS